MTMKSGRKRKKSSRKSVPTASELQCFQDALNKLHASQKSVESLVSKCLQAEIIQLQWAISNLEDSTMSPEERFLLLLTSISKVFGMECALEMVKRLSSSSSVEGGRESVSEGTSSTSTPTPTLRKTTM